MKIGFDNDKYLKLQTERILGRIKEFDNKLYIEFGGKLFDDLHASRVLPGFAPDAKVQILQKLKDKSEIIFVISANDIERNKIRADFSITYDMDVLRQIDCLREAGLTVSGIVITLFTGQPAAITFSNRLTRRGEKVYFHKPTKGYPTDVNTIVSDEGYGANPYIETTKPLVIITAPGPGSGKLATCLSQLYHEYKRGVKAGYAKFETFPVWNLPLNHPVNIAKDLKKQTKTPAMALELSDGVIVTGRTKELMTNACACVINAIKHLAKIDDSIELIPQNMLEPVIKLKREKLGIRKAKLSLKDVLMLLSINSVTNPTVAIALSKLDDLKGCEAHTSSMLNSSDQSTLLSLGINVTSEPNYSSQSLYNQE